MGQVHRIEKQNKTAEINKRVRTWVAFWRLGDTPKNRSVPICLKRG